MRNKFIIYLAAAFVFSACTKKKEDDKNSTGGTSSNDGSSLTAINKGGGGGGIADANPNQPIRNAYAEKNWPEDKEEENQWIDEYKAATTPEEKMEVIGRKQTSGPEELGGLIKRALREPNERVRIEAVQTLTSFFTLPDEVIELVVGAVHDPSSEVRILSMEAALEFLPETQVEIYKQTIAVPEEDVRKKTIVELGRMSSKPAFEVLMTGLQNEDPAFRQQVNFEIKLLVDREFASYEQAKNWWDGPGEKNFSENMTQTGEIE